MCRVRGSDIFVSKSQKGFIPYPLNNVAYVKFAWILLCFTYGSDWISAEIRIPQYYYIDIYIYLGLTQTEQNEQVGVALNA